MSELILTEQTASSITPSAGRVVLYAKTDGYVYFKDDAGLETRLNTQTTNTAANWTALNPVLAIGVFGVETDTGRFKIGDGITAWTSLAYWRYAAEHLTINTTGGITTLSIAQNRASSIAITGVLTSNAEIVVANTMSLFVAENLTTGAFTVTFKTAAGTGVSISQGNHAMLYADGVNVELPVTAGAGAGDVVGPASAVDGKVVLFNGTTGKLIKDSGVTLGTAASSATTDFAPALGANDNYVTDAEKTVIGNTSGTNTGDNAANSSTHYIGTTAVALNRASAAQALTGITSIDGNAATVTTNANLSGHVTSVGNTTSLGSFTVAQLNTAISDADVATGGGTATNTNTGDNTVATALTGTPSITVATVTTTGNIELGHASDTTLSRVSAGVAALEGSNLVTAASLAGGTLPASVTTLNASQGISTSGASYTISALAGAGFRLQNTATTANWNLTTVGTTFNIESPQAGTLSIGNNTSVTGNLSATGVYSTTTASASNVFVETDGTLKRSTSMLALKTDIENMEPAIALRLVELFRAVWYRSLCPGDNSQWSWFGGIAEEVAAIDPRFVHWGYLDTDYEMVTIDEGDVDEPVMETVLEAQSSIEIQNGVPVQIIKQIEKQVPKVILVQVVDADGVPVTTSQTVQNGEEEVTIQIPLEHPMPVTRKVSKSHEERKLKTDAVRVPVGLQYERFTVPLMLVSKLHEARIAALEAR